MSHANTHRTPRRWPWMATATTIAILPVLAFAAPVALPHTFATGDPIRAEEFNENFDALAVAIDDNDARIAGVESSTSPPGAVIFFDGTLCPDGWSELEVARGRALVGLNGSAGMLQGTVGTELDDMEDRQHNHTVAGGASVNTGDSSVPHSHTAGTLSAAGAGEHNHRWLNGLTTYNSSGIVMPLGPAVVASGPGFVLPNINTSSLYTDNETAHTHPVTGATANSTNNSTSHRHSVALGGVAVASGSGALPYLQLLVCRRN